MKQSKMTFVVTVATLIALAGCAMRPMGPSVAVMPAAHKPFDVFQQEMSICKQYAEQQVSGQAEAANAQAVGTAFLSTGLGAALGGPSGAGGQPASGRRAARSPAQEPGRPKVPRPPNQPFNSTTIPPSSNACMRRATRCRPSSQRLPPHSDRPRDDRDRWTPTRNTILANEEDRMKCRQTLRIFGSWLVLIAVLLALPGWSWAEEQKKEAPQQHAAPPRNTLHRPQQHAAPPQQHAAPRQQHAAPPPQQHAAPAPQQHAAPPPNNTLHHHPNSTPHHHATTRRTATSTPCRTTTPAPQRRGTARPGAGAARPGAGAARPGACCTARRNTTRPGTAQHGPAAAQHGPAQAQHARTGTARPGEHSTARWASLLLLRAARQRSTTAKVALSTGPRAAQNSTRGPRAN